VKIEEAKDLFDVNVFGPVRVLQAVLPGMRKTRSGHIINLSSTSGMRGIPCFEFYTGSKFALEGIMDSLRYTLLAYNISVTNLNAGPVRTAFTDRFGDPSKGGKGTREIIDDVDGFLKGYTDKMITSLNRRMQSTEAQSSEDVARVVLNIVKLRFESKVLREVPFNFGSSRDSQAVIESVRTNPTGWGGVYDLIAQTVPALQALPPANMHAKEL
jgi:short-subunit dehydrogenase